MEDFSRFLGNEYWKKHYCLRVDRIHTFKVGILTILLIILLTILLTIPTLLLTILLTVLFTIRFTILLTILLTLPLQGEPPNSGPAPGSTASDGGRWSAAVSSTASYCWSAAVCWWGRRRMRRRPRSRRRAGRGDGGASGQLGGGTGYVPLEPAPPGGRPRRLLHHGGPVQRAHRAGAGAQPAVPPAAARRMTPRSLTTRSTCCVRRPRPRLSQARRGWARARGTGWTMAWTWGRWGPHRTAGGGAPETVRREVPAGGAAGGAEAGGRGRLARGRRAGGAAGAGAGWAGHRGERGGGDEGLRRPGQGGARYCQG